MAVCFVSVCPQCLWFGSYLSLFAATFFILLTELMGVTLIQDLGLFWETSDLPIPMPQAVGSRHLMGVINKWKLKTLNPTIITHNNPNSL